MANENSFSYEDWKEYLNVDKDMKSKWNSLTDLGENVRKSIRKSFDDEIKNQLLENEREKVSESIFNLLVSSKEELDFSWKIQTITKNRGHGDRQEYYIYCPDIASNSVFGMIKSIKGVANMHGESINKYLKPVSHKIWALKMALRTSATPEAKKKALSYEIMKIKIGNSSEKKGSKKRQQVVKNSKIDVNPKEAQSNQKAIEADDEEEFHKEVDEEKKKRDIEDAERNYGPNSRDTVDSNGNVVPNEAVLNQEQFRDKDSDAED